jgi:MFS family permease
LRNWPAFDHANYRWFWAGLFVSRVGTWMLNAALPYALFELTRSPLWVGAAGAGYLFPQMLTSIPGGLLADRRDRRRVLLELHVAMLGISLLIVALWSSGNAAPWPLLVLSSLLSALIGLQMPAAQTVAGELVPPSALANAIHGNVVAYQAARAIGPLLAGFVLASSGPGLAFAIDSATYAVALLTLALVRVVHHVDAKPSPSGTIRDVWATPGIAQGVIATGVLAFLGPPVIYLSTLLAEEVFDVGPAAYGWLLASYGIGSVAGAVALGTLSRTHAARTLIIAGTALLGAGHLLTGFTEVYSLGLLGIALAGICGSLALGSLNAVIQTRAHAGNRGKAVALYLIALNAGGACGSFAGGAAADHVSVGTVVGVAGLALLPLAAVLRFQARVKGQATSVDG